MVRGTGRVANAGLAAWQIAGKTGTTENFQDAWFTGFLAKEEVLPSANPPLFHRVYQVIAWIMVATLGVALLVHFTLTGFKLLVLGVEVVLLA